MIGRHLVHCAYLLGPSYCSFGCSHCYLPRNANRVPLPALADLVAQIEATRRQVGPGGHLQITGGDVVDAYARAGRSEELVAVVRAACDAGLVPMLMTHGQGLLDRPDELDRLVVEGGLRRLAVHVDITQHGRPGYSPRDLGSEADLAPVREAVVELVLGCRRRTGLPVHAAHTLTVTAANLGGLGEILHWLVAEPRRLEAIRMLSLQTEAAVGRTRIGERSVSSAEVWAAIEAAVGRPLARDTWQWGHPECSSHVMLLVLYPERRIVPVMADEPTARRFWERILAAFAGLPGRGEDDREANLRRVGQLLRRPGLLVDAARFARTRLRREGLGAANLLVRLLRGRIRSLNVVLHNFMDEETVRRGGPEVEQRLAACAFRGAVRRDGEWTAVPMCAVNAGEREALYDALIAERSQ